VDQAEATAGALAELAETVVWSVAAVVTAAAAARTAAAVTAAVAAAAGEGEEDLAERCSSGPSSHSKRQ